MTQLCPLIVLAAVSVTFLGAATASNITAPQAQCEPGSTLDGSRILPRRCVACEAGTYKTLPGNESCTPCPRNNSFSSEGSTNATSCECDAGYNDVMSLSCTGSCPCFDHSGPGWGTFRSTPAGSAYGFHLNCSWTISGTHPSVNFTSYNLQENDFVTVQECYDWACSGGQVSRVPDHESWSNASEWFFESSTQYLCITFHADEARVTGWSSFEAAWKSGMGVTDACLPCEAGTYKTLPGDNQSCTTCPLHASSAAGSTTETSCECAPGYVLERGVGCVACEAGTYKPLIGDGACMPCPLFSVSNEGSAGCMCGAGYTVAYTGEFDTCVACAPGAYKPWPGSGPCQALSWIRLSTGGVPNYGWVAAFVFFLVGMSLIGTSYAGFWVLSRKTV